MRDETKLIHAGYTTDPTTKSVAVPIYQTVAYEFDSAQHGADLFDLLHLIEKVFEGEVIDLGDLRVQYQRG